MTSPTTRPTTNATFAQKWGDDPFTEIGHTQIPNALVEYGARLGLRSEECWLICCILRFKYGPANPSTTQARLAELFGQSIDTVQRTVKKIVDKRLLVVERHRGDQGQFTHVVYNFTPLRFALNECYYQDHPQERPVGPATSPVNAVDQAADLRPGATREPGRKSAAWSTPQICGPLKKDSRFVRNSSKKPLEAGAVTTPSPAAAALAKELIDQDLNRADAYRLVRANPDECRRQLEYLPYVTQFKSSKGAYLRSAIEEGYGPPKGYAAAQQRLRKAEKRTEAKKARTAEDGAEAARRDDFETHKENFRADPAVWQEIEAEAEQLMPKVLRNRPTHASYNPTLKAKIDEVVAKRAGLASPDPVAPAERRA